VDGAELAAAERAVSARLRLDSEVAPAGALHDEPCFTFHPSVQQPFAIWLAALICSSNKTADSLSRACRAAMPPIGLKHPRQSFRYPLYVRVEREIGAASHFSENPERTLRGT
jgi:hypothetical protein